MKNKERIEILEKAKELLIKGGYTYLCPVLYHAIDIAGANHNIIYKIFPELAKYKPKNKNIFWWESSAKEPRLEVLNSMIKEIKAKL